MRLQEVDTQFREYNGRLELLESQLQQLNQHKSVEGESVKTRLNLLQEALEKMEQRLDHLESRTKARAKKSSKAGKGRKLGNYGQAQKDFSAKR